VGMGKCEVGDRYQEGLTAGERAMYRSFEVTSRDPGRLWYEIERCRMQRDWGDDGDQA
jgi:hypothetical protein